jgi:hypothetical protein
LEPWNLGTLEPWNPGTLEPWNLGTLEPWNPGTPIYSLSVTPTYVRVLLLEAAIIAGLVILGRLFS